PAEELLEADELADLQVDDAEVLDALVDALGSLERVDRQAGHAVVEDAVAAKLLEGLRRGGRVRLRFRQARRQRRGGGLSFRPHRSSPVRGSCRRARTLLRSSCAPNGLAR